LILLAATPRGLAVLDAIHRVRPDLRLTILSFPEHGAEPRYFEALRARAAALEAPFHESRRGDEPDVAPIWREPFDAALLVHWRYLIPAERLSGAARGAFVIHDSLLPLYRGFSPTVWAIANGEPRVGATLFRLEEDVDSGPIVGQVEVPVGRDDTISDVMERVTAAYVDLVERNLTAILEGRAALSPQDHAAATRARRRTSEDNRIDWTRTTESIRNLIRAVGRPYPGAYSRLGEHTIRIWKARQVPDGAGRRAEAPGAISGVPGTIVEIRPDGAVVLTGDGALVVELVQLEGEPPRAAAQALSGAAARFE
jgi:methionyl-tRNA formyltransferase